MVGVDGELLPQAVLRQIGDKLYEKRKLAALEVEQLIKRLALANDQARVRTIIDKLIGEFAFSPQANHRKVRPPLAGAGCCCWQGCGRRGCAGLEGCNARRRCCWWQW
jgi:hypothetical protein